MSVCSNAEVCDQNLMHNYDVDIERELQDVLSLEDDGGGNMECGTDARDAVTGAGRGGQKLSVKTVDNVTISSSSSSGSPTILNKHMLLVHTLSPGAESNHDSCYDSDTSPSRSRRNSSQNISQEHNDVSRTVSETLAAELQDKDDGNEDDEEEQTSKEKVKYWAMKLGYNEQQVSLALDKLGYNAGKNELLSVLTTFKIIDDPLPHSSTTTEYDMTCDTTTLQDSTDTSQQSPMPVTATTAASDNLRHIIIDGSNVAMR